MALSQQRVQSYVHRVLISSSSSCLECSLSSESERDSHPTVRLKTIQLFTVKIMYTSQFIQYVEVEERAAVVIAALNSSSDGQSVTNVGIGCSSLELSLGRRRTCRHSVLLVFDTVCRLLLFYCRPGARC